MPAYHLITVKDTDIFFEDMSRDENSNWHNFMHS